ncbi:pYEATS domain-containing protein [Ralstonia pseudosolanacearum]
MMEALLLPLFAVFIGIMWYFIIGAIAEAVPASPAKANEEHAKRLLTLIQANCSSWLTLAKLQREMRLGNTAPYRQNRPYRGGGMAIIVAIAASAPASSSALQIESINKSPSDMQAWSIIPAVLWPLIVGGVLFAFRREIAALVSALVARVQDGASIKLPWLEIGPGSGPVAATGKFSGNEVPAGSHVDSDGSWRRQRTEAYGGGVMLVHRIQRSRTKGQLYDVLIYVLPHKVSLAKVAKVEYYFGSYWQDRIYPSQDRSRGFPIVTGAYGSFLCLAKITFNDEKFEYVSRYIDFEMGAVAPQAPMTPIEKSTEGGHGKGDDASPA